MHSSQAVCKDQHTAQNDAEAPCHQQEQMRINLGCKGVDRIDGILTELPQGIGVRRVDRGEAPIVDDDGVLHHTFTHFSRA